MVTLRSGVLLREDHRYQSDALCGVFNDQILCHSQAYYIKNKLIKFFKFSIAFCISITKYSVQAI
jgi:hypothetical protein